MVDKSTTRKKNQRRKKENHYSYKIEMKPWLFVIFSHICFFSSSKKINTIHHKTRRRNKSNNNKNQKIDRIKFLIQNRLEWK